MSDGFDQTIKALEAFKAEMLENAVMPIPGLSFVDDDITYNGVPFSQISSAESIRVSTAIAMALNPSLRILQIKDGSLLDNKSMAIIEEMAAADDFQVWIEKVDETGNVGVFIENGEVANA